MIGYSGHAYVAIDVLAKGIYEVTHYYERQEKESNPFDLNFLGDENKPATIQALSKYEYFVGIGDIDLRKKSSIKIN
jgi:hypothetical protein